nr:unnamed protein product [Digitaria exilis]
MVVSSAAFGGARSAGISVIPIRLYNLPQSVMDSQRILLNKMIGSASSSDTIKKLVKMVDDRRTNSELRLCAMRIVAYFASEIRLDMPDIWYISSGLSVLEDEEEMNSKKYELYFTGMKIISRLANDEENFKHMSKMDGITHKIVAVIVGCSRLHCDEAHDEWLSIASPGIQLINRFVFYSSKSSNVQHLREIQQQHENWIKTLQTMLQCQKCKGDHELRRSVILALTQIISIPGDLSVQHNDANNKLREGFIKSLVAMFLHGIDKSSFKKLAGESLAQLSFRSGTNAKLILSAEDGIVGALTTILQNDRSRYRRSAADNLKHLCVHCNCEDTNSENLKQAMIREIPEVLKEVLRGSREQQNDHYLRTNYVKVQEALASLCATVHEKLISTYPDLIEKFNTEEATNICRAISKNPSGVSFADLVTEAKNVVEDYRKRLDLAFFIF